MGLFALLALPAILALHFFRRRLRVRRVAGLFLFRNDNLAAAAGRTRTDLMRSASLACELLAALVAALLLAGLSFDAKAPTVRAVIVLDDSASMSARGSNGAFAGRARAVIKEFLDRLGPDCEATLILTGPRAEVVAGPRGTRSDLKRALAAWTPAKGRHEFGPALDLGQELAGADDTLLFVTDAPRPETPPRYLVRAIGEPVANAAIASARRLMRSDGEDVMDDVVGFGPGSVATTIRVRAGAAGSGMTTLGEQPLAVNAGEVAHVKLAIPPTPLPIEIELGADALAIDNFARLLPEPRRVVSVAVLLDDDAVKYMRLDRAIGAIDDLQRTSDPATANLVFSALPGAIRAGVTEVVISAPGTTRHEWMGPFLLDRRSPLVAGLTLDGVVWSGGDGELSGAPVAVAGNQSLITDAEGDGGSRVTMNLDPSRSNFGASPDWPILLSNVAERARAALPGPGALNVRIGDEMVYRTTGGAADAAGFTLVGPDGAREDVHVRRTLTFVARRVGIHRLLRGDAEVGRWSVQFVDLPESDLAACGEAVRQPVAEARIGGPDAHDDRAPTARRWLAMLMLAAILLDWVVLRRAGGAA